MKRATALQVLAASIVLVMVVSAFPLAEVVLRTARQAGGPSSSSSPLAQGTGSANAGHPLLGPAGDPLAYPSALPAGKDGPSSHPAGAGAHGVTSSGSAIIDQVLSSARMMGYDVKIPDLPVEKLAPVDPLRPAILAWIAATNSVVPPTELEAQLQRADALPQPLQRDLALLLLSAVDATALQAQALAKLSPAEVKWIYAHPELATDLARGVDSPDTRELALLAGLVDASKSVEASLLLLQAVEATRGGLQDEAAKAQLAGLNTPSLDATTTQVLQSLSSAASNVDDQSKVLFAARLIATTTHVPMPGPVPKTSFPDAVAALISATGQQPSATDLKAALDTASLLPDDLQQALAAPLKAEADAVNAANPLHATPDGQAKALVGVLAAIASALPTLEKYHLYWKNAPEALRVGQWDPAARTGWAAEHAALLTSTHGNPVDLVRAGGIMRGAGLVDVAVPDRSFVDAYVALQAAKGMGVNDSVRAIIEKAGASLDPRVRDAAAHMLSGAAEAGRLNKEAFSALTPEEKSFLLVPRDTASLYLKPDITMDEVRLLAKLSYLGQKVDINKLTAAEVVGTRATVEAKDMLSVVFGAKAQDVKPYSVWDALLKLVPWRDAKAQGAACTDLNGLSTRIDGDIPARPLIHNDCANDVLLVIDNSDCGLVFINCWIESNNEALVITGTSGSNIGPGIGYRFNHAECPPGSMNGNINIQFGLPTDQFTSDGSGRCKFFYDKVPAFGAATVFLDLGGSDTYTRPVAVTTEFRSLQVALHLDMGGSDVYNDPTSLYDHNTPLFSCSADPRSSTFCGLSGIGYSYGHPTQGAAIAGGVALLVDAAGGDTYQAPSLSQGYGQWGLGMVADLGLANDNYFAREYAQGAASREMSLGLGILVDQGGDDHYRATSGEGYGLGGILLDLGGSDTYSTQTTPQGAPIAHLTAIPGGDVTTLNQRGNNHIWLDGPGQLDIGVGIDTETSASASDSDRDGYSDFAEFIAGTNPNDPQDTPVSHPLTREEKLAVDSDGDTFPDFVERALSTDPNDKNSYPAGFVQGPTFFVPVVGQVKAGQLTHNVVDKQPEQSDKIIDLRLPLQNAGTLDFACVGPQETNFKNGNAGSPMANYTGPGAGLAQGQIDSSNLAFKPIGGGPTLRSPVPFNLGGLRADYGNDTPQGGCVIVGYQTSSPGSGKGTTPGFTRSGAGTQSGHTSFSNFTFRIPAGILAVGDAVNTKYDTDYFFVADLGGDDSFRSRSGGALLVVTSPTDDPLGGRQTGSIGGLTAGAANSAFFAPSVLLNIDLSGVGDHGNVSAAGYEARVSNANDAQGNDKYAPAANDTSDYLQGSLESVIVDTFGDDSYTADGASQGSLGGVLLDLQGNDIYSAGNLSQGASLVTNVPSKSAAGVPGGDAPRDYYGKDQDAAALTTDSTTRTTPPGLFLDFGGGNDYHLAGWNSQGFARGFSDASGQGSGAIGTGILYDDGGDDRYITADHGGLYSQGVGGWNGIGILLDGGGNDTYRAWGIESQGAPISASSGTFVPSGGVQQPGAGILIDAGGNDTYAYYDSFGAHDRTAQRRDNLTLTRTGIASPDQGAVYAQPGVHLDTEARDSNVAINTVLGTGAGANATSVQSDPTNVKGFYVNIPTARLAIGSGQDTTYTDEYAFVVDLGGKNTYRMNAGGFVPQLLARSDGADPTGDPLHPLASLYPVSFLLDAGTDGSNYVAPGGLAQGAGYFSVGVLADLGGNDSFVVLPTPVPSLASSWMPFTPTLDGTIGAAEWANAKTMQINLTDLNDSRFVEPLTLRVANDARNIFVALSGHTSSTLRDGKDTLLVDLNGGRSLKAWDAANARTLLDLSVITLGENKCTASNDYFANVNTPKTHQYVQDAQNDTRVGCSVNPDGTFTIELVKPLRAGVVRDEGDLDLTYGANGFTPSELGFHVELQEHTTGTQFTWPAGTVDQDGANGYRPDANLSDELQDWAVVGLASLGRNGTLPIVTKTPAFAQGAGIAGVGILATLGQLSSDGANYTASDRAQGYATFGGLGVLVDAGGSDTYTGGQFVQGAADVRSLALFLEADGNDVYRNAGNSLGWAPSQSGALFADLAGYDTYLTATGGARDSNPRNATVTASGGSSRDMRGATTVTTAVGDVQKWSGGQGGFGVDTPLGTIVSSLGPTERLFGHSRVTLTVQRPTADGTCSGKSADFAATTFGARALPVVNGLVCLVAKTLVTDASGRGAFAVDSVEFMIDGQHYSTVLSPVVGGTLDGKFVAPLDVTTLRDGVKSVFAQAIVRTDLGGKVIFFRDQNADTNADALARIVVNNPAHAAVCTLPKLDVDSANATDPCASQIPAVFSPKALNATRNLSVLWGVSHDANEDQHELAQGWTIPADKRNVPCPDDKLGQCNIIPLWFRKTNDASWNTELPNLAAYDPDATYVQYEGEQEYTKKTPILLEDLTVAQKEGFHVRIYNHSSLLLPGTYTTRIRVTLLDAENHTLATIAEGNYSSRQTPLDTTNTSTRDPAGLGGLLSQLFQTVRDTIKQNPTASDTLDTVDTTLASKPVPHLWDTLCADPSALGYTANICGDLNGDPGLFGNVFPCRDQLPWNALPQGSVPGCNPTLGSQENETANFANDKLGTITGRGTVNDTGSPDPTRLAGWTDFYVDLKTPTVGSPLRASNGAITIPAGSKFQFDMFLTSDNPLSQIVETYNLRQVYRSTVGDTTESLYPLYARPLNDSTCASTSSGVCTFVNLTIDGAVRDNIVFANQGIQNSALGLVGHPVPLATFHYGDASNPSVFEIRSPITPHTAANLAVEPVDQDGKAGAPLVTLTNANVAGDVVGSPTTTIRVCEENVTRCHRDYAVASGLRFTQHNDRFNGAGLPDGLYRVHMKAADDSTLTLAEDNQTFLLDQTPPATIVTTGRGYVGAALLSGGNKVPVSWDAQDAGAGIKQVAVWGHTGSARITDKNSWRQIGCPPPAKSCPFPAGVTATQYDDRVTTITDYYFITVGEDRAGNVELQDRIRALGITEKDLLYAGFLAKLQDGVSADGGFEPALVTRLIVDSGRPESLGAPVVLGSRAIYFQGVDAQFVKANAPFTAKVCAKDQENGIARVQMLFDYVDPATGNVTSFSANTTSMGACPQGGDAYVYSGWGDVNGNKTRFPDGAWAVSADIYDLAGNRAQVSVANVILDSKAPIVTLQGAIYPGGQEAVKPGDRVTLRLLASDEFGVDPQGIVIDASAVNASGQIKHCVSGGGSDGCVREVRINGKMYEEATIKVDVLGSHDGSFTLPVTVPDLAGNAWTGAFNVTIDTKKFDMVPGTIRASDGSYNSIVIHWKTTEGATSMVRFGLSPLELKSKTPVNTTLVTDHKLLVTGLQASTRYFMRVVSATAGGYTNESDVFDVVTGTALYLQPTSPVAGSAVSGAVPVRFSGGLRDSQDPVSFTLEVQPSPDQPWSFVTTLTETGQDHELTFNSTRFLDAATYRLRLTAAAGKDASSVVIGPFLSDNTVPELNILAPLVATNDTTPQVVADARDNLADFDGKSAATLTIDGQAVTGLALEVSGHAVRLTYDVPSALAPGFHTFALAVTDKAGNVASETWKVAVDGQPPVVTVGTTTFSPGTAAAKHGGTVTLNVSATDASGVASVLADTSGIADKAQTRLDHVLGTSFWTATFNVAATDLDAVKHVGLTATDIAGNVRLAGLDITVDNAPPAVGTVRTSDIAQTKATLTADANEPITLFVTATATGMPTVTARTPTASMHPTLALAGLLPSRTYAYQVQALDRAGNEVDQSGTFQTALDLKPPTQVSALSVLDLLDGTLRLSWPEARDDVAVAFYRVYRSDANGTLRPIAEVRGLTYDDVGLPLEKTFTYQVAAVDYGGNEGTASSELRATATAVPHLTGGVASPTVGSTATLFRYVIRYSSPGGVAPTFVRLILDGAAQDMRSVGDGSYAYETRLAPHARDHPHTYSFEAGDGRYTVRFPEDGSSLRGPLVSGDASADAGSGFVGFAQKVPMLGVLGTASALAVAAAAVIILRRRGSK